MSLSALKTKSFLWGVLTIPSPSVISSSYSFSPGWLIDTAVSQLHPLKGYPHNSRFIPGALLLRLDPFAHFLNQTFHFQNKGGQIGGLKTTLRRRNAVSFHSRLDMFVVRISILKGRIVGMRLRIVPVKLFLAMPNFVPILVYYSG
jgi:hypothetical protein